MAALVSPLLLLLLLPLLLPSLIFGAAVGFGITQAAADEGDQAGNQVFKGGGSRVSGMWAVEIFGFRAQVHTAGIQRSRQARCVGARSLSWGCACVMGKKKKGG